jgi:hypothetical protein
VPGSASRLAATVKEVIRDFHAYLLHGNCEESAIDASAWKIDSPQRAQKPEPRLSAQIVGFGACSPLSFLLSPISQANKARDRESPRSEVIGVGVHRPDFMQ